MHMPPCNDCRRRDVAVGDFYDRDDDRPLPMCQRCLGRRLFSEGERSHDLLGELYRREL